jgi:hypothetical protein
VSGGVTTSGHAEKSRLHGLGADAVVDGVAHRTSNQVEGRKTLCDIKYQILNNEFEY